MVTVPLVITKSFRYYVSLKRKKSTYLLKKQLKVRSGVELRLWKSLHDWKQALRIWGVNAKSDNFRLDQFLLFMYGILEIICCRAQNMNFKKKKKKTKQFKLATLIISYQKKFKLFLKHILIHLILLLLLHCIKYLQPKNEGLHAIRPRLFRSLSHGKRGLAKSTKHPKHSLLSVMKFHNVCTWKPAMHSLKIFRDGVVNNICPKNCLPISK